MNHGLSQIRILQAKIHKVINDICNINMRNKARKTTIHKYMVNPNTSHNSGRTRLSGENHHPELVSLMTGEGPEEPSPELSTAVMSPASLSCFLQPLRPVGGMPRVILHRR